MHDLKHQVSVKILATAFVQIQEIIANIKQHVLGVFLLMQFEWFVPPPVVDLTLWCTLWFYSKMCVCVRVSPVSNFVLGMHAWNSSLNGLIVGFPWWPEVWKRWCFNEQVEMLCGKCVWLYSRRIMNFWCWLFGSMQVENWFWWAHFCAAHEYPTLRKRTQLHVYKCCCQSFTCSRLHQSQHE